MPRQLLQQLGCTVSPTVAQCRRGIKLFCGHSSRLGMTLIELILVLAITVALLTILLPALALVGRAIRIERGADAVAAALVQARNRAIFSRQPHGVRFTLTNSDTPDSLWSDTIEYISLPPPLSEGYVYRPTNDSNLQRLTLSNDLPPTIDLNDAYIALNYQGQSFRIEQFTPGGRTLIVSRPVNIPNNANFSYVIYRTRSEPVSGLRPGKLSQPVVVDRRQSKPVGVSEIIFAPDGSVYKPNSIERQNEPAIMLWVARYERDTTSPAGNYRTEAKGAVLVTVFPRTGRVATFPVNTDPDVGGGDPYYFARNSTGYFAGH